MGDYVGSGAYIYGGTSGPCPCFATHGFLYNNGQWTDLTPIGGYQYDSNAEAVNDSHEVVGQTTTISSTNQVLLKRAFVYIDGTTYKLTFYLVGGPTALLEDAYWINCQGNIAAVGVPNNSNAAASLHNYLLLTPPDWPSSGGTQCTGGTSGGYIWARYPLSNIVVGDTCEPVRGAQAAKWIVNNGSATLTDLGRLPGALTDENGPFSVAYGFNNVGDIVGQSQSSSPTYVNGCTGCVALHGFIYNNGAWTDLVPIAGPQFESIANSVNDSHEVVGWTNTQATTTGVILNRAFVYTGGTMYNLTFYLVGGPTALLTNAYWIDCEGDIAAVGTPAAGGTTHNYLLIRQGTPRTDCPP